MRDVIVVGAGVAGLAAASALAQTGYSVRLLERRPYVGGRASSYEHPALQTVIDCQHVLLGCCTNLIHLLQQSGDLDKIRWYDELTFLEPGGRTSSFAPGRLPAPMHYAAGFLKAAMLGWKDKLAIARGLSGLMAGIPVDDSQSLDQWMRQTKQTPMAIKHFWEPVVLCTLNDGFEACSTRYAAKVFRELFLKSRTGGRLGIPTVPLSDLYDGVARLVQTNWGVVQLRASVERVEQGADGQWHVFAGDNDYAADAVVLALPFEQTQKLLKKMPRTNEAQKIEHELQRFVHAPYTTVHLWYDRQITDLDHAALLDTTIQWMFHKSRIRRYPEEQGSYVELVIAASRAQLEMERSEILGSAIEELQSFFPEVKQAKLLKSGILKEARATFSVIPGLDANRPTAQSPWPRLFFAGDWTATEWPSTMESAARGGYLAAEALTEIDGDAKKFLQPDLAPDGWMRIFG